MKQIRSPLEIATMHTIPSKVQSRMEFKVANHDIWFDDT